MLQAVDEIDDAVGALRLFGCGLSAEVGLMMAGCLGLLGVATAIAMDTQTPIKSTAAIMLSAAALLRSRGTRLSAKP